MANTHTHVGNPVEVDLKLSNLTKLISSGCLPISLLGFMNKQYYMQLVAIVSYFPIHILFSYLIVMSHISNILNRNSDSGQVGLFQTLRIK